MVVTRKLVRTSASADCSRTRLRTSVTRSSKGSRSSRTTLKRVATPDLLDHLAENALSLRFGDATFAREVYADLRKQVITAAERWYDVQVAVRISPAGERDTSGVPLFDLTRAISLVTRFEGGEQGPGGRGEVRLEGELLAVDLDGR